MNKSLKQFLRLLWQSVVFWTFAMFCYAIFRFYGMDQEVNFAIKKGFEGSSTLAEPILALCSMGFGLGVLYALVDFLFEKYMPKTVSLGLNLLIKMGLYFVVTIFIVTAVVTAASNILSFDIDLKPGWWIGDKRFWSAFFYIIVFSFVFSFVKIATEKFGKGVFLKMLLGKYKNPKEEKRIFMFLDLKDSTTIAEQLGHFKYSQLIQDCFYDLNEVVPKYDAEIYQYVGDEAVLSWPYKKGLANTNCVSLFFAFQQQKLARAEYYSEKYGIVPQFKAGLHGGILMVAEVGIVKKELAYHGDVINTSARIQGECNKNKVPILISEALLKDLRMDNYYSSTYIGAVMLKGKHERINIHTLIET
ncbi:MAG: adenylate/guanylate cyclase domain-containing protein [Aurantibacter sp.]